MNDILASATHQSPNVSHRHYGQAIPRGIITIWSERMRTRWELDRMAKDNPYLIDDIGLTIRQVEAEIAKPFWQR